MGFGLSGTDGVEKSDLSQTNTLIWSFFFFLNGTF